MKNEHQGVPSATFSPPSNAGVILWLQGHQVAILAAAVLWILVPSLGGRGMLHWGNLPALAVIIADLIPTRRGSVWQELAARLGFGLREATGQTKWTVSPMAVGATTAVIDLPGAAGERIRPMQVVGTRFGGASYIEDRGDGTATAVIRAEAEPWAFAPPEEKTARALAFANICRTICTMPGVTRVTTQARTLARPNTDPGPDGADPMSEDRRDVRRRYLAAQPAHDVIVTITIDPGLIPAEIRQAGGGRQGVSEILADRVMQLARLLPKAGIARDRIWWQSTGMLRAAMKTLTDPSAHRLLDDWGQLPDDIPIATGYREYPDCVQIDRMWAASMWIDRWPSTDAVAGWLSRIVTPAGRQCILTQAWKANDKAKELKTLNNRMTELQRIHDINQATGRRDDPAVSDEMDEIEERRRQLGHEEAGISFQGYLTLLAPERDMLVEHRKAAMAEMSDAIHTDAMTYRQWAGWVNALPLGQAGR